MDINNLIIKATTEMAHNKIIESLRNEDAREVIFGEHKFIEVEDNDNQLIDYIENITGDWDKVNGIFEFSEHDNGVIKDYSFIKNQIENLRESLIMMNADTEDNGLLEDVTNSFIEIMELISCQMVDEKDFLIRWIESIGFKFRTHDWHNGKCAIEIKGDRLRVRDDRKGVDAKVKHNGDGYFYSTNLDVTNLEMHLEKYDLI